MSKLGRFYITTPIYYTNDKAHLGHVFEVIGIDAQARFRRLLGHEVYFLSGTDEHGQKIQAQAAARGVSPKELVDGLADQFKALWSKLEVSNNDFIRTTEARHHAGVHKMWKLLEERGHIYRGKYEGWYNSRDEAYYSEKELIDAGLKKDDPFIKWTSEDVYYFKLASFQKQIEKLYEERPDFVQPTHHANQMLNSFIKPGLQDLCISRSTITWGIPVPNAPGEVVYVWLDALTNYLSAIGFGANDDWQKWWPADVHVVGKDILKFHTIIWPAMLMAAGVELPKRVFGHGFITLRDAGSQEEVKMSKSKGNIIDPEDLIADYGVPALRYHLMREFNYAGDGAFTEAGFRTRYNADLANGLGNLVSRALNLIEKNFSGAVPPAATEGAEEQTVVTAVMESFAAFEDLMPKFDYARALTKIWEAETALDKYIDTNKPWALAKDPAQRERLGVVMYTCAEGIRALASLIYPFMPSTSEEIWKRLGISRGLLEVEWADHRKWGLMRGGEQVTKGDPLFMRLDK